MFDQPDRTEWLRYRQGTTDSLSRGSTALRKVFHDYSNAWSCSYQGLHQICTFSSILKSESNANHVTLSGMIYAWNAFLEEQSISYHLKNIYTNIQFCGAAHRICTVQCTDCFIVLCFVVIISDIVILAVPSGLRLHFIESGLGNVNSIHKIRTPFSLWHIYLHKWNKYG